MSSNRDNIRKFNHYQWYRYEDGVYTVGLSEQGIEDITEINSLDLPAEEEEVEREMAIGVLETDDGSLEIFSPVAGEITEVNDLVEEDPNVILEDCLEEGWLFRVAPLGSKDEEEIIEDEDEADDEEEDRGKGREKDQEDEDSTDEE